MSESELAEPATAASGVAAALAIELALAQPTLPAAFQVTAAASADRLALRSFSSETRLTWSDYAQRVQHRRRPLCARHPSR